MDFMSALKKQMNTTLTDNGDKAYVSTGSYCLDYFALVGGMRHNPTDALRLFVKAYNENPVITIKLLFYTRDINGGLGERNVFRFLFSYLCLFHEDIANKIMEYIPEYGRYDDLLFALNTDCEAKMISIIKTRLNKDLEDHRNGKSISLLAKWLPSINTSSSKTQAIGKRLCKLLGYTEKEYRSILSTLRKGLIIENNLRLMDYTFDYEKQTSQSMFKYKEAFLRNDKKRYNQYLEDVAAGTKKLSTKTLFPYQVIREINDNYWSNKKLTKSQKEALDITWNNLPRINIQSKTLVVRDGSGSMFANINPRPIDVATSLAILFSEQLPEPFKNTFITFSTEPRLVKIMGDDIYEKVFNMNLEDEVSNTDIYQVYKLILDTAKDNHLKPEDMIERIIIISDMEFDSCVESKSTYETFKDEYKKLGYKMLEVVFWNVYARNIHLPVRNENNVKLISGSSSKIFEMVMNDSISKPYDLMIKTLEKYQKFDNILK